MSVSLYSDSSCDSERAGMVACKELLARSKVFRDTHEEWLGGLCEAFVQVSLCQGSQESRLVRFAV